MEPRACGNALRVIWGDRWASTRSPTEPVAFEAGTSALATATLMVTGGLLVVGATIAGGLAWEHAFSTFLWSGLWFAALWFAFVFVWAAGTSAVRRTRKRPKRTTPELPSDIRLAAHRDIWVTVARSQAPTLAFAVFIALVDRKLGAILAGFTLLGGGLVPVWAYWRFNRAGRSAYIVRGPGRRQWYATRGMTGSQVVEERAPR